MEPTQLERKILSLLTPLDELRPTSRRILYKVFLYSTPDLKAENIPTMEISLYPDTNVWKVNHCVVLSILDCDVVTRAGNILRALQSEGWNYIL